MTRAIRLSIEPKRQRNLSVNELNGNALRFNMKSKRSKLRTPFLALAASVALSACGGGVAQMAAPAPSGPLFVSGAASATSGLASDERSMRGTVSGNGQIPSLMAISKGASSNGRVAWDGFRITLIGADGSKTYDLAAGDSSVKRFGRKAILKSNGDYAAYLNGEHSAAATYVEKNQPSIRFGAFSVGNITQDMAAAPAQATYTGTMNGQYVGKSTTPYDTHVAATLDADFANSSFRYDAGTPVSHNTLTGASISLSSLNMSGFGTINGDGFDGTVISNGGMDGSMSGNFYGPNAEEAGGTVGISGIRGDFVGAFNLKR